MQKSLENTSEFINKWIENNNSESLKAQKEYYTELATDDDEIEPFETWRHSAGTFQPNPLASAKDIVALESAAKCSFPTTLSQYLQNKGGFAGETVRQDLTIKINRPDELLKSFTEEAPRYERLSSLGLIDMMNWVWGNDKSFLILDECQGIDNRDGTYTDRETLAGINNEFTCYGVLMDGGCESHLFLHFDSQGKYGATYWHQDENIPLSATVNGLSEPQEAIAHILHAYDSIIASDPDDPYFCLDYLPKHLTASLASATKYLSS